MKKSGVKDVGFAKKWFFGLLVFSIFTSLGSIATASTITITGKGYGGPYHAYKYAGEWIVSVEGISGVTDGTFRTFCLERTEFVDVNGVYNAAVNTMTDGGLSGPLDPLDPRTAWLYTQYLGKFSGYPGLVVDEDAKGVLLQEAIWALEGELLEDELTALLTDKDNKYYALATTIGSVWTDIGNVRVLNLTDVDGKHQDLLAMVTTRTLVPVPGAVWLLGSGLLGLAGIRMRSKKNRSITTKKKKMKGGAK
ncbi:MAG: hypothetical protein WC539_11360 [Nitrospirota bacterium]